jgi:plasmid stabilization system protein ParE
MGKNMENKLEQIAQGVADVTLELMEDSIDWQLADFPQDGDEYSAIHSNVLQLAIKKMYLQTKHD